MNVDELKKAHAVKKFMTYLVSRHPKLGDDIHKVMATIYAVEAVELNSIEDWADVFATGFQYSSDWHAVSIFDNAAEMVENMNESAGIVLDDDAKETAILTQIVGDCEALIETLL